MDEISDLVNYPAVSRVKQQISADLGTFLDGQTLLRVHFTNIVVESVDIVTFGNLQQLQVQ